MPWRQERRRRQERLRTSLLNFKCVDNSMLLLSYVLLLYHLCRAKVFDNFLLWFLYILFTIQSPLIRMIQIHISSTAISQSAHLNCTISNNFFCFFYIINYQLNFNFKSNLLNIYLFFLHFKLISLSTYYALTVIKSQTF